MKYLYRLLCLALITCILGACGGGGSAGCSIAVGGLTCSGGKSSAGGSASPTSVYEVIGSMGSGSLNNPPSAPQSNLVEVNGIFYGTTINGGDLGLGTVFSIDGNGKITVIHSFQGSQAIPPDGASPFSGLTLGSDGNLYGTTISGGTLNNYGTIYKVQLTSGNAIWGGALPFQGGPDGANPYSGLTPGASGLLYGTTYAGGQNENGTIYQFSINQGGLPTVIYRFNGNDGAKPQANLFFDPSGILYGTTSAGGLNGAIQGNGFGTVFAITISTQTLKWLYQFTENKSDDTPLSSLLLASDGRFYGTTSGSVNCIGSGNCGTVFSLMTNLTAYVVNHKFNINTEAANPIGNLVEINHLIYGTTIYGGIGADIGNQKYGDGKMYSMNLSSATGTPITLLHSFGSLLQGSLNLDGINPSSGLTIGADGYYYGSTSIGGNYSIGTIYKYYP